MSREPTDRDRLQETLQRWTNKDETVVWDAEATTTILNAARAVLNATEYDWCVEHSSNGRGPSYIGEEACHYSALRQATIEHPPVKPCRFVSALLLIPKMSKKT